MFADPEIHSNSETPRLEATTPAPPTHGPTAPGVLGAFGLVGAIILFVAGFMLFAKVRRTLRAQDVAKPVRSISDSTKTIAAFAAIITGYHLCAWSLDDRWLPLRAPVERWWLVPGLAIAAILASFGVDLVQSHFDKDSAQK